MLNKLSIKLTERGSPEVISKEQWIASGCGDDLERLATFGAIKLTQSGDHLIASPKALVGVFNSPRLKVQILSKKPELTHRIVEIVEGWKKKVKEINRVSLSDLSKENSLWKSFENLLLEVLREGLPWQYTRATKKTSGPSGKILFKETINKLMTRGINHQVFCEMQEREYSDSLVMGLQAVRRFADIIEPERSAVRSRVLRLISIFGESSSVVSEEKAIKVFKDMMLYEGRPSLYLLCEFCIKLLQNNSNYKLFSNVGSGMAEFVDLEKLWENAVQVALQSELSEEYADVVLHPLRTNVKYLFVDGGPKIDPDIMVFAEEGQLAVVDAKYKIEKHPLADDIYQLTSYMTCLNCRLGILVYVSSTDESKVKFIGTLEDGRKIFALFMALDIFESGKGLLYDSVFSGSGIIMPA